MELEFTEEDLKWSKKFNPIHAELIIEYASEGMTEEQISALLGISPSTLTRWKSKYANLCATLNQAKKRVNDKVKVSLYQRALGYEYDEEKTTYDKDRGEWVKTVIRKHIPADPAAAVTWLKFRDPENWKEDKSGNENAEEIKIVISEDDEKL